MPRGTEHEPVIKLKRHDELKLHYTKDELQELEDRARGWMRMDADVKIKLINGNRYALEQRQLIRELWHEAWRVAKDGADISPELLERAKLYI